MNKRKEVCYYCGKQLNKEDKTIDHKIPVSRGGNILRHNKVPCCWNCNQEKADMTHKEYNLFKKGLYQRPALSSLERAIRNREERMEYAKRIDSGIININKIRIDPHLRRMTHLFNLIHTEVIL
jgi:CRISPR/Cas system Type II protein with McrA/HNH and RuvC-like nuclease domain